MDIRAITFDVFGTLLIPKGPCRWLDDYAREVHTITKGEKPWRPVEAILVDSDWNDLVVRPGVTDCLQRLFWHYTTAALSNAGGMLGWELARKFGLPWKEVLETERVEAYKPDPKVYRFAWERLTLLPEHILHVASHPFDLRAAKHEGFRTALVRWGDYCPRPKGEGEFDFDVDTLADLVAALGEG